MSEMMTTREVADYLRIKERKVYDLVRKGRIPCTRAAGKWLFPKTLIDLWLLRGARCRPEARPPRPPAVIVGSHDPLLEWAVRESGSDLAILFGGSLDGLRRFVEGAACACGLHVFDPATGGYNEAAVREALGPLEAVLIEWAWREQGLVVASGNPHALRSLADLRGKRVRFMPRQEGAGSRILLAHLLAEQKMAPSDLTLAETPALTESDVAAAVRGGAADAGLAIRAVAGQFGLDFVPLHRERYDLAVRRREYFEPRLQRLLGFARSARFAEQAAALGGYDVSGLGRVLYNGP